MIFQDNAGLTTDMDNSKACRSEMIELVGS